MAQHTSPCGTTHLRQQGNHVFQQPKSDYKAPQFLSLSLSLSPTRSANRTQRTLSPGDELPCLSGRRKKLIPVSGRSKCTGILLFPLLSRCAFFYFPRGTFLSLNKRKHVRNSFSYSFSFKKTSFEESKCLVSHSHIQSSIT